VNSRSGILTVIEVMELTARRLGVMTTRGNRLMRKRGKPGCLPQPARRRLHFFVEDGLPAGWFKRPRMEDRCAD
jgi:hypothetical protein